jgi:hypothetical protein
MPRNPPERRPNQFLTGSTTPTQHRRSDLHLGLDLRLKLLDRLGYLILRASRDPSSSESPCRYHGSAIEIPLVSQPRPDSLPRGIAGRPPSSTRRSTLAAGPIR